MGSQERKQSNLVKDLAMMLVIQYLWKENVQIITIPCSVSYIVRSVFFIL